LNDSYLTNRDYLENLDKKFLALKPMNYKGKATLNEEVPELVKIYNLNCKGESKTHSEYVLFGSEPWNN
jgi:hypothetical protein